MGAASELKVESCVLELLLSLSSTINFFNLPLTWTIVSSRSSRNYDTRLRIYYPPCLPNRPLLLNLLSPLRNLRLNLLQLPVLWKL